MLPLNRRALLISVTCYKLVLRLSRKVAAFKEWKYLWGYKTAAFETIMVLTRSAISVLQEKAARHVQLKLVLGPAHGDVEKPTLLLDPGDIGCQF